jgi:DNA primase
VYEEIKRNVRISNVLRRYGYYVPDRLTFRIACPIHHGRDANFSVDDNEGLWNCFSVCGRGGSVIDLVALLEGISVPEAVKKLREDFQLTPMQASARVAREYKAKSKRFSGFKNVETIEKVPETTPLEEGCRGLTTRTIQYWGLAQSANGIYIPLFDSRGRTCGYSIRRFDGKPKYENAYGIGKALPFGLHQNKQDIIDQGFAFVVEGQMDCISLWQKSYKNCIALMGSSMTEQQAMSILAVISNLTLVMDGDEAGRVAAAKIKRQWQNVFDIRIFELPEGDPDEFQGILER